MPLSGDVVEGEDGRVGVAELAAAEEPGVGGGAGGADGGAEGHALAEAGADAAGLDGEDRGGRAAGDGHVDPRADLDR